MSPSVLSSGYHLSCMRIAQHVVLVDALRLSERSHSENEEKRQRGERRHLSPRPQELRIGRENRVARYCPSPPPTFRTKTNTSTEATAISVP